MEHLFFIITEILSILSKLHNGRLRLVMRYNVKCQLQRLQKLFSVFSETKNGSETKKFNVKNRNEKMFKIDDMLNGSKV